jgi:hypothetical protein
LCEYAKRVRADKPQEAQIAGEWAGGPAFDLEFAGAPSLTVFQGRDLAVVFSKIFEC